MNVESVSRGIATMITTDTKPTIAEPRVVGEPYYTAEAVSAYLSISKDTVARLFADRPGVIDVAPPPTTRQFRRRRRPKAKSPNFSVRIRTVPSGTAATESPVKLQARPTKPTRHRERCPNRNARSQKCEAKK